MQMEVEFRSTSFAAPEPPNMNLLVELMGNYPPMPLITEKNGSILFFRAPRAVTPPRPTGFAKVFERLRCPLGSSARPGHTPWLPNDGEGSCSGACRGGSFLRGAPLPAAQQRPWPLPWAERPARRHDGGGVVASASAAAGVRSMSRIPQGNTGLYDPSMDRDSCGVGFIAELSAEPSRKTVSAFRDYCACCLEFILPC